MSIIRKSKSPRKARRGVAKIRLSTKTKKLNAKAKKSRSAGRRLSSPKKSSKSASAGRTTASSSSTSGFVRGGNAKGKSISAERFVRSKSAPSERKIDQSSFSKVEVVEELGNGTYGLVQLVNVTAAGSKGKSTRAAKKMALIDPSDTAEVRQRINNIFQQEIKILEAIHMEKDNENWCVKLIDANPSVPRPYFLMEYQPMLDAVWLKTTGFGESPSMPLLYKLAAGLFKTVDAMHRSGWCHLDIKPENFITADASFQHLKLIDVATAQRRGTSVPDDVGTEFFRPPVVLSDVHCDWFAYFVTLINMVTRTVPFVDAVCDAVISDEPSDEETRAAFRHVLSEADTREEETEELPAPLRKIACNVFKLEGAGAARPGINSIVADLQKILKKQVAWLA